jgi:lipopolysaccharide/colanic/teichoic acid biosynthesis glycosyltransferase
MENYITEYAGSGVYEFIKDYVDPSADDTFVIATSTAFNVERHKKKFRSFVNLSRMNDIRWINKFFELVNSRMEVGDTIITCAETYALRKKKIDEKYTKGLNSFIYAADFVLRRVSPKLKLTQKLFFALTKGRDRPLSKAEALGRVVSCGFELVEVKEINNLMYIVARKVREPYFDENPSYGPLFCMRRVGKGGNIIGVYKYRTMYPYSEYLQEYMLEKNGYGENGKIANDFRVTTWGKVLRRYWLDELPQLLNVLKGNMKLVGVRPISKALFKDYPDDVKTMRVKYKPGCFPPYVALLMDEMNDSIEAERIYLEEKEKRPYTTDMKYFFKSVYNILTNKIRSA